MTYYSQAWQDEFVNNILNFKRNGYYLDIGSGPPDAQSNSYFFDSELNWKGICVEQNSDYVEKYRKQRTCEFINGDATKIDYKKILQDLKFPSILDFLSVDTDENSSKTLSKLPLDEYKFNIILCEHDQYRLGDTIRNEERECLRYYGYYLLFSNVQVPLGCGCGPGLDFEDWWVNPTAFNMEKISKMSAERMYPDDIVKMIKERKEIYTI